jgi:predicted phosphodiesterase
MRFALGVPIVMRLGLVTDIHNQAAELARALALFAKRSVDQVVTIGDTYDPFARTATTAEVASLLETARAVGVWGNHDFTLCRDVSEKTRKRYPPSVLTFMARMQPRLTLGECFFSHKEASVDPHDLLQLWEMDEQPLDLLARARRGLAAEASRWQFVGHYHRWWATTPGGPVAWVGKAPLSLAGGQRFFVVVGAVCDGWCATLDTTAAELQPLWCGPA